MSTTPNGGIFTVGAQFRTVARLPLDLDHRKVAALIAAAHDAGRASVTATQLAERLGWDRDHVVAVLDDLRAQRVVAMDNLGLRKPKRYRVARAVQR